MLMFLTLVGGLLVYKNYKKKRIMLKQKKSQTGVLVTILLILIVIAAVAVVGAFIIKFVRNNTTITPNANLYFDKSEIGPYYNNETQAVYVSVKRGNSDENINFSGIRFVLITSGNSKTYDNNIVPDNFEKKIYALSSETKPDTIEIAPIIRVNDVDRLGVVSDQSDIVLSSKYVLGLTTDKGWKDFDLPNETYNPNNASSAP